MWTGRATSCSNTVRWHVAVTNRFVCTGEFLGKSLSLQRNFVAATSRKKSNQTEFVRLVAATKFCCSDKDFHKNSPVHTKRFVAAKRAPHHVAATCRLVCTDLKRKENEITTAVSRTYENATHIIVWFVLGVVTREHKCPLIVSFCFQFLPRSLFWFKTLCLTRC